MKQLPKQETKDLEHKSMPMIMAMADPNAIWPRINVQNKWFAVLGWHTAGEFTDDPIVNKALHLKVAAMSKLLGFKQNYHVNYWERNAVWGLEHEGIKFVVYLSTRGLSVQLALDPDGVNRPTPADAQIIVDLLFDKLIGTKPNPTFTKYFGEF